MIKQEYTSANTSINSSKLPKIYRFISERIGNGRTIDYGCGKFYDKYRLPDNYVGYDPYNKPNEEVLKSKYEYAICSNVLNVIKEPEVRHSVLHTLKDLAGTVFISVYEGNKSGVGRKTKDDCYQLNWSSGNYIPELIEVFGKGNVRWNRKGYFECRTEVI